MIIINKLIIKIFILFLKDLDIDLVAKNETNNNFIKVHFSNTLSKNIWYQLTQVQLNYYNNLI